MRTRTARPSFGFVCANAGIDQSNVATPDGPLPAIRKRGGLMHGPGHIFKEFLPEEALFAEHPEYFPIVEGKRTVTGKGACFSNPKVRRLFVDKVRTYLQKHPYSYTCHFLRD